VILISLILITSLFTPILPQEQKSFAKVNSPKTIALIHHNYLYFVNVMLNDRSANLLIDTGAASYLLDINQATDYKFKYRKTDLTFAGVGGLSHRYVLSKYKFNHDTTSLGIYPHGADLKFVVESFSQSGIEVVGVLGSDFLKANNAIIDYKHNNLIIR